MRALNECVDNSVEKKRKQNPCHSESTKQKDRKDCMKAPYVPKKGLAQVPMLDPALPANC